MGNSVGIFLRSDPPSGEVSQAPPAGVARVVSGVCGPEVSPKRSGVISVVDDLPDPTSATGRAGVDHSDRVKTSEDPLVSPGTNCASLEANRTCWPSAEIAVSPAKPLLATPRVVAETSQVVPVARSLRKTVLRCPFLGLSSRSRPHSKATCRPFAEMAAWEAESGR